MSNNTYAIGFSAAAAVLTVIVGKILDWFVGRKNRKSETDRNDAESDRADFESAIDVARLRLEDFNRVTEEVKALRVEIARVRTEATDQDRICTEKIRALQDIIREDGERYQRQGQELEDVKRQLAAMRRGLSQAGGSST